MGRKKNKWFKKCVLFYRYVFKFEVPYKIIIDGNFVAVALNKKFEMKEILAKALDENVHLIIPSCIVHELREIDSKLPGILQMVLKYKIEECQHGILSPDNCIKTYIGKKNHKKYFVATQDKYLRMKLRKIPGVPLLFFDQNMILIDKPSAVSREAYDKVNKIIKKYREKI